MTTTPPPEPGPGSGSDSDSGPERPKSPEPEAAPPPPYGSAPGYGPPQPPTSEPPTPYPPYGTGPYGTGQYGADPYAYGRFGAPPVQRRNGLGMTAMILGIIGLVVFWLPGVSVVLGVLAIVFGAIGMKRANRGQATNKGQAIAGLVLGIIGVIATVAFWVWAYNLAKDCNQYTNTTEYDRCVRDKIRG